MCKTKLHRFKFGRPGDWQFRLACGLTAYGWYLKLGIIAIKWLRSFICRFCKHIPLPYTLLPGYENSQSYICLRCNRTIWYRY